MAMDGTAGGLPPYRAELKDLFSPRFNGYVYFGLANAAALAGIVGAAWFVREVAPLEWLTVPAAFLVANVVEWLAHRGPMHHRRPFLDILFERHTLVHHRYFPHDDLTAPSHREWGYVLFPSWAILIVLAGSVPLALAVHAIAGRNPALLFYATAISYYLLYEWLHLAHHLPESHPVARLGLFRVLRQHHLAHHHKRLMQRYNFNVTFPVADYVLGTAWRGPLPEPGASRAAADAAGGAAPETGA